MTKCKNCDIQIPKSWILEPCDNPQVGFQSIKCFLDDYIPPVLISIPNNAIAGQVLTLVNPTTGESEYQDIPNQTTFTGEFSSNTTITSLAPKTIIHVNTSISTVTVTLPSPPTGEIVEYWIKDVGGDASNNFITINAAGGESFDGQTTQSIIASYGILKVYSLDGAYYTA